MALSTDTNNPKRGMLARLADGTRNITDLILGGNLSDMNVRQATEQAMDRMQNMPSFDSDYVGIEMLLGNSGKPVRSRSQIYSKWHFMMQEGMINIALRNNVQMALGGHETTGETIFIEPKPKISRADRKLVDELMMVAQMLNNTAHHMCFNASGFGDSYARLYTAPKEGVIAFNAESLFSPLVQPYEELGRTVGVVSLGEKLQSRMSHLEIVRMKMPRMLMLPQMKAIENAQKINLEARDLNRMIPLPGLVGGSLLEAAEHDFDNLYSRLARSVGAIVFESMGWAPTESPRFYRQRVSTRRWPIAGQRLRPLWIDSVEKVDLLPGLGKICPLASGRIHRMMGQLSSGQERLF